MKVYTKMKQIATEKVLPDTFSLTVIRSARKTAALEIRGPGEVIARVPQRMSQAAVRQFVESHRSWIDAHLQKAAQRQQASQPAFTPEELRALAREAAEDLPRRAARFAPLVGVRYGRVTIRSQHTRWGSCSAAGNLNFNCLLMRCPEAVRDYVVVHELCHRLEMNHSPRFWSHVARVLPDYAAARDWLRREGQGLTDRLPK